MKQLKAIRQKRERHIAKLHETARKYTGREIAPGFVAHVSEDVKPETIEALQEMGRLLMEQIERKEKK